MWLLMRTTSYPLPCSMELQLKCRLTLMVRSTVYRSLASMHAPARLTAARVRRFLVARIAASTVAIDNAKRKAAPNVRKVQHDSALLMGEVVAARFLVATRAPATSVFAPLTGEANAAPWMVARSQLWADPVFARRMVAASVAPCKDVTSRHSRRPSSASSMEAGKSVALTDVPKSLGARPTIARPTAVVSGVKWSIVTRWRLEKCSSVVLMEVIRLGRRSARRQLMNFSMNQEE
jgi:hypothetical protein